MGIIKTDELTKPLFVLSDDLERAEKDLIANDDSYSRRNYIRVLFAAIELTMFVQKQTILIAASDGLGLMKDADLHRLRKKDHNPLADRFLFITRSVEKGFGLSLTSHTTGPGWDDFTNAIALRNRITHPKKHQDFEISDAERELVIRVVVGLWDSSAIGFANSCQRQNRFTTWTNL
jgi:hypothetical protein